MNNNDARANDRLLKMKDIQELLQLSRSGVYTAMRLRGFPQPVKIGGASRWWRSEVFSWMNELSA